LFLLWWAIWSPYILAGDLVILQLWWVNGHFMYWWLISHWVNWGWAISHWAIYHVPDYFKVLWMKREHLSCSKQDMNIT